TPSAASTSASTTARSPSAARSARASSSRSRWPQGHRFPDFPEHPSPRRARAHPAVAPVSARVRPFARGLVPAPTASEGGAHDRHAIAALGVPRAALMECAGRSVAALVQRLYPSGEVVGVVGAGHNGGDALVTLRTLAAWGRTVCAVV